MKKYKVLVVDDSAFIRKTIVTIIEKNPKFEVIGIARNGLEAIEKNEMLQPDVITMDVEMDKMNGIEALKRIMKKNPTPVIMLSEFTETGAKLTVEALSSGAFECILKSELIKNIEVKQIINDFYTKLESAANARIKPTQNNIKKIETREIKTKDIFSNFSLLFIGCSTGGPNALQAILPNLPADFPIPVFVVQHMPKGFTSSLAERFNKMCNLRVKEAEQNEIIKKGHIYIAPSGYQTVFKSIGANVMFKIEENTLYGNTYSPSLDVSLNSISPIYKEKLLTVVLTGMGKDGLKGCELVHENKGYIITESEETCVVYGMPKVVAEAGLSNETVNLYNIYKRVLNVVCKN